MNKRSEQELFLNYIRDIYIAYPSLEMTILSIMNFPTFMKKMV